MFTITKEFRFEAAHHLPHHDGKCRRRHGHSFVGRLVLQRQAIDTSGPKSGMAQDFGDVSAALKPLLEGKLDHWDLNETLPVENPTSEEICRWLYSELKPKLPLLAAVELNETCTSEARYEP